jgi:hypothetical protein
LFQCVVITGWQINVEAAAVFEKSGGNGIKGNDLNRCQEAIPPLPVEAREDIEQAEEDGRDENDLSGWDHAMIVDGCGGLARGRLVD